MMLNSSREYEMEETKTTESTGGNPMIGSPHQTSFESIEPRQHPSLKRVPAKTIINITIPKKDAEQYNAELINQCINQRQDQFDLEFPNLLLKAESTFLQMLKGEKMADRFFQHKKEEARKQGYNSDRTGTAFNQFIKQWESCTYTRVVRKNPWMTVLENTCFWLIIQGYIEVIEHTKAYWNELYPAVLNEVFKPDTCIPKIMSAEKLDLLIDRILSSEEQSKATLQEKYIKDPFYLIAEETHVENKGDLLAAYQTETYRTDIYKTQDQADEGMDNLNISEISQGEERLSRHSRTNSRSDPVSKEDLIMVLEKLTLQSRQPPIVQHTLSSVSSGALRLPRPFSGAKERHQGEAFEFYSECNQYCQSHRLEGTNAKITIRALLRTPAKEWWDATDRNGLKPLNEIWTLFLDQYAETANVAKAKFFSAVQDEGETVAHFLARLKRYAILGGMNIALPSTQRILEESFS